MSGWRLQSACPVCVCVSVCVPVCVCVWRGLAETRPVRAWPRGQCPEPRRHCPWIPPGPSTKPGLRHKMGAVREARQGIRVFVSAHSSRWARQAPPLPPSPHLRLAPVRLASPGPEGRLSTAASPEEGSGRLRKDFYHFAVENISVYAWLCRAHSRGFCHGKESDHKLLPNGKDAVSKGDVGSDVGLALSCVATSWHTPLCLSSVSFLHVEPGAQLWPQVWGLGSRSRSRAGLTEEHSLGFPRPALAWGLVEGSH